MRYHKDTIDKITSLLDGADAKYLNRVNLIAEVGSTAHGISAGTDDLDFMVVWTESYRDLLSLVPKGTRMIRTQPEGTRSGPGDIDLQVYSMRKYATLVAAGNPSILVSLFTPAVMRPIDREFPDDRLIRLAYHQGTGRAFLGYMDSQLKRWEDGKVGQRVKRQNLIDSHGYDTKYAAHAIRLAYQGVEFLDHGRITMPMAEPVAGWLRDIRAGQVKEEDALLWAQDARGMLASALDHSTLPPGIDHDEVGAFLYGWQYGWLFA